MKYQHWGVREGILENERKGERRGKSGCQSEGCTKTKIKLVAIVKVKLNTILQLPLPEA